MAAKVAVDPVAPGAFPGLTPAAVEIGHQLAECQPDSLRIPELMKRFIQQSVHTLPPHVLMLSNVQNND
jgi:hypothetical protein